MAAQVVFFDFFAAMMAAVELLTVKGNTAAAIKNMKLTDSKACSEAFTAALAHHFDGVVGGWHAALVQDRIGAPENEHAARLPRRSRGPRANSRLYWSRS